MKTKSFTRSIKGGTIACYMLLAFFAAIIATFGSDQENNHFRISDFNNLGKLTDKERANLLSKSAQSLKEIQETLLNQFHSESEDAKFCAAYLMGSYRLADCAETLARNIKLEDETRVKAQQNREWFWDRYPAMEALIAIGSSSISAVIQNLSESDDSKVRDLSIKVIYYVEKDRDIAQLRIHKAVLAQSDPKKRIRLQTAEKVFAASVIGK